MIPDKKPFRLLPQQEFYSRLAKDIDAATHQVDLHFYIAHKDKGTLPLFDAIERASRRNVRIRFMFDKLSSIPIPPKPSVTTVDTAIRRINRLQQEGLPVEVQYARQDGDGLNMFRRNHKKLAIIDSGTPHIHGYVGGSNIAGKFIPWRDSMTHVTGDIAQALEDDFTRSWEKQNQGHFSYHVGAPEDATEILVDSKRTTGITKRAAEEIDKANHTVWLETTYLRGTTIRDALIRARKRNPHMDIRLLVPHPAVSNDPLKFLYPLLFATYEKAGIPVYLYGRSNKQFNHAKTLITDDTVMVGSSNFVDGFVVGGNAELVLLTKNPDLYKEAKEWVAGGIAQSERYRRRK